MRLRSLPIKADTKMPRKAAAAAGAIDAGRASAHAYVVFAEPAGAEAALAHNMQEVCGAHVRRGCVLKGCLGASGGLGARKCVTVGVGCAGWVSALACAERSLLGRCLHPWLNFSATTSLLQHGEVPSLPC